MSRKLIKDLKDVTGVVEHTDHRAIVVLTQKLHPDRDQVVVIIDRTPTGDAISNEFVEIEKIYKGKLKYTMRVTLATPCVER